MIRLFYNKVSEERYIMFRPSKIENRVVEGTYYIERDFKKIFPSCDPYYFSLNDFDDKHLNLKQFKIKMI